MSEDIKHWSGPSLACSPEELAERDAIGQLAKIYALGLDMRDYDLARSAFADEATGIGKQGPEPIDDYLKATYQVASSFHATQHLIANQYIRVDGDEALLWSYGVAHHKVKKGEQRDEIIAGVQYRDKCRKYPWGWLIVERGVELLWMDMAPPR